MLQRSACPAAGTACSSNRLSFCLFCPDCVEVRIISNHTTSQMKNFTKSSECNPKTKQYKFKCNYCPEGSALIQHHENRCLQHIMKPTECQHTLESAQKEAWLILAKDTDVEVDVAGEGGSVATALVIDDNDEEDSSSVVKHRTV